MSLSTFLVAQSNSANFLNYPLPEIKRKVRNLSVKWLDSNPDELNIIKNNFEIFTGKSFLDNKESILFGIADHYFEKILGYRYDVKSYVKLLEKIEFNPSDVQLLKDTLKTQVPLLFGGHFSGNEFFPCFMGAKKLPFSIFARFKKDMVKKIVKDRMIDFNYDSKLCDVSNGLQKDLINIRKEHRVVYTVVDSFESWKINSKSLNSTIFGKNTPLDINLDKMVQILDAKVFWSTIIRENGDENSFKYRFVLKEIKPKDGKYIIPLMKQWEHHITTNPFCLYSWNEAHEIWDLKT